MNIDFFSAGVKDITDPVTLANPIIEEKATTGKVIDLESASVISASATIPEDFTAPTEEEQSILRKVPGSIPLVAYALCFVELAERASYYGAKVRTAAAAGLNNS